jgi:hypothetical protein
MPSIDKDINSLHHLDNSHNSSSSSHNNKHVSNNLRVVPISITFERSS